MHQPDFVESGIPPPPPPQARGDRTTISPSASPKDSSASAPTSSHQSPTRWPSGPSGQYGRGRAGTDYSNHSHMSAEPGVEAERPGLRRRAGSRRNMYNRQNVWFEEHHGNDSGDASLLLASLDKDNEAAEDHAETALLEILEHRTFVIPDAKAPSRHRRGHSRYASTLPSIDLLNLGASEFKPEHRPVSAPASSEAPQPLPRPSLQNRSISSGRSKSKRNLLGGSPPTLRGSGRATTAPEWAFDSQGQLQQSFSELPGPDHNVPEATLDQSSSLENRTGPMRHQRFNNSSLPLGLSRHISDSSRSSGETFHSPWEKARHVAHKMKQLAANNVGDLSYSVGEGDLPDLMQILEAHKENDHESVGSGRRSHGSRSKESHSRENGSQSRGSTSGLSGSGNKGYRGRPFAGIFSTPLANDSHVSDTEKMFQFMEHVEELHQIPEAEEDEESTALAEENQNFLSQLVASHPEVPDYPDESEEVPMEGLTDPDELTPMMRQKSRPSVAQKKCVFSLTKPSPNIRFFKFHLWWSEIRKQVQMFAVAFDVPIVKERLWSFFQVEFSLYIIPALAISAFFYYQLGNPILSILPTDASVSWWILFLLRNYLTLQLAFISEYLVADVLTIRSLISVKLFGPLATLYIINAQGWPFIIMSWGWLNILLIQDGSGTHHEVFNHWLFFSEIEMFTTENPSGGVVESDVYREMLVSMIIVGVATSVKRTMSSLYLAKRSYIHYKPKLEKLLETILLLIEVAKMGEAIDDFEFEKMENPIEAERNDSKVSASTKHSTRASTRASSAQLRDKLRTTTMINVVKHTVKEKSESESDDEESENEESKATLESGPWNRFRTGSDLSSAHEIEPTTITDEEGIDRATVYTSPSNEPKDSQAPKVPIQESTDEVNKQNNILQPTTTQEESRAEELASDEPPITTVNEPVRGLLHDTSTATQILNLLDEWEEPVNKQDKTAEPTLQEILNFRNALKLLEDTHPFGQAFGPASTRDLCIKSSKSLYKRLLSLSPGSTVLHFDIIGVLAYNVDGIFDNKKAKSLVRLFRPDKFDEVSLLHFVQSCDGVYKRLRYLRASHGNSTLIDSVLESIFNGVFSFFLGLTIMSVLNLNPWTLLVSMSTVLVSFAFALGPSAAKMIEGMIMIAVRRPFDLGDRISIVDYSGAPDNSGDPGYHDTWIVEDCNLFTTTLRLSRTNEVSTVTNGSIANTRIVNHGRSINALVNISLPMRLDTTNDQVQIVKSAIEQYIRDQRGWTALLNFRITKVDPAYNLLVYSARIQHTKSWQDLLPVLQARGDLDKFCTEILIKLDIYFEGFATTNDVFIKELPMEQPIDSQEAPVPLPSELPPSMSYQGENM